MKQEAKPQRFHVKDLTLNASNELDRNGFHVRVFHGEGDPKNAHRIRIKKNQLEVEFLPSKGLSLSQAWIQNRPVFWEPPIDLCDTEELDLWSDEIHINGEPSAGFTFLKTLYAGLEFYGLNNWGMPVTKNGKLELLHGETSNIPIEKVDFGSDKEDECWIEASFVYRTFEGDSQLPWYERGEPIFRVTRRYMMHADSLEIRSEDRIENVSSVAQRPDWGYHITLRPEEGARLLVPSKQAEERGGGELPTDMETWYPAKDPSVRTETGIIHKNLLIHPSEAGPDSVVSLLRYTDGTGLAVSVPPSPYFQTWFCHGGKGSGEFTDRKGESILLKNWDGMGLEIGSSALDHNDNVDETVNYKPLLHPGESISIPLKIKWLAENEVEGLAARINTYKTR
jgi:hypothetical protein